MWGRIADWFGIEAAPFDGTHAAAGAADGAGRAGLGARSRRATASPSPISTELASPWHTDADLGRPIEVVTDMSKSRRLGFTAYQPTDDAFFDLFAQLRADRLIP